jgi:hypothetical protein
MHCYQVEFLGQIGLQVKTIIVEQAYDDVPEDTPDVEVIKWAIRDARDYLIERSWKRLQLINIYNS